MRIFTAQAALPLKKCPTKELPMASFTTAADVIAAAIEIERRGFSFYQRAAGAAAQTEDKDFFTFMAAEEQRHEKIFEGMLRRVGGLELPAGSNEAEYLEYVGLLLDSHAMFLPEGRNDAKEPLHLAMSFEKDSILFFMAMRRLVSTAEQEHVDGCIEEEQRHLRLLAEHGKARAMALRR
jgi:rubrerythrin